MLTMQALVSCDEFGCVHNEPVTLKVFHGEVLVKQHGCEDNEAVSLTQFELFEDEHTSGWTVNFSGDLSYCPEHKPGS